ncbi:MAG TPA: DMT family transporter [Puia sp.]|jgi:drug/metabolite transporter (DMT)-like permease
MKNNLLKGFLISFTGAILFSTKAIIVKLAFHATSTDALTLLTLRMSFSLPFYLVAAWWGSRKEGNVKMTGRQWGIIVLLGLLGYYFSSYFDFVGLQYVSAGLERLILFLYPSFAVLINAVLFKQPVGRVQRWALLLSYTGIGIAYFGELKIDTGNPNFYWGSFLIFLCAITYAFYLSGSGRMIPVVGAAKFTTYSMLVATVAVLLHFFLHALLSDGGLANIPGIGHSQGVCGGVSSSHGSGGNSIWGYAVLLALFATVIPSFMLSAGMKRIGPNNAAIVTSVGPVSTILQAHFILGDKIFPEQLIGTGMVILGVLLIGWQGRKTVTGDQP